jgi:hypothetical protein
MPVSRNSCSCTTPWRCILRGGAVPHCLDLDTKRCHAPRPFPRGIIPSPQIGGGCRRLGHSLVPGRRLLPMQGLEPRFRLTDVSRFWSVALGEVIFKVQCLSRKKHSGFHYKDQQVNSVQGDSPCLLTVKRGGTQSNICVLKAPASRRTVFPDM